MKTVQQVSAMGKWFCHRVKNINR